MSNVNANAIAVEELRVGMFVQLEGGWLSHPFPRSAFKLSSPEQIDTLRGLGLGRVAWVPEKSDLPAPPGGHLLEPAGAEPAACAEVAQPRNAASTPTAQPAVALPASPASAAALNARSLHAQMGASRRCEGQRAEVENQLRHLLGTVQAQPQEAGRAAVTLTQSMLDNMLDEDEVGIRLINAGNDREIAHALNVSVVSMLIGRTLGMSEADLVDLGVGALLHDVGKQTLPPRHRQLVEGLSTTELQAYREHVNLGLQLGARMALSPGALAVLAQHHEQADGAGFPLGLTGDRISLAARVVAIVNRYDALCNPRGAAQGLTPHEAVAMLFAQYRQRFDGMVLNAFIRMMGVYPAGSIVQLTDDRYALVVGANSSRPLKPRVLVFDPRVARAQALLLDLELERDLGIRRSLAAQKLPVEALNYLNPRPRVSYYFEPLAPKNPCMAPAS